MIEEYKSRVNRVMIFIICSGVIPNILLVYLEILKSKISLISIIVSAVVLICLKRKEKYQKIVKWLCLIETTIIMASLMIDVPQAGVAYGILLIISASTYFETIWPIITGLLTLGIIG